MTIAKPLPSFPAILMVFPPPPFPLVSAHLEPIVPAPQAAHRAVAPGLTLADRPAQNRAILRDTTFRIAAVRQPEK
jgi:hypothetical protein